MPGAGHRFAPHARARAAHFVGHHFSLQRIAMNTELFRRGALIAVVAPERALNHALFQDLDGLLQEESSVEQVIHQPVKSVFHFFSSPRFGNCRIPFSRAALQAAFTWASVPRKPSFKSCGAMAVNPRAASTTYGVIRELTIASGGLSPRENAIAPITIAIANTDLKSTRLNSSHANISYAVFCLQ